MKDFYSLDSEYNVGKLNMGFSQKAWELFWDWCVRDRCPPPTDDAKSGRRWSWRHSSQFDTRKGEAEAMVEAGGLLKSLRMNEVNSTEAVKWRETQSR